MRTIWGLLILLPIAAAVGAQNPVIPPLPSQNAGSVYICPMDPDVRSNNPGTCARCGMKLVANPPDPKEYHLDLTVTPRPLRVGEPASLKFEVHDPWKDRPVTNFVEVHERLFHAFVVS